MLHVQLQTLATCFKDQGQVALQDIVTYLKELSPAKFTVKYLLFVSYSCKFINTCYK